MRVRGGHKGVSCFSSPGHDRERSAREGAHRATTIKSREKSRHGDQRRLSRPMRVPRSWRGAIRTNQAPSLRSGAYRVFTRKRVFLVKSSETPSVRPSARTSICGRLSTNCGRDRMSWWLTFCGVTHRLAQRKSPAVMSDTEPITMTAKGVHDPIVNQYRP